MVQSEEVISFFTNLKSYQRISLMCKLLYRCMPFELRFVGSCLENLCKKDYQELRHAELEANGVPEITTADLGNLSDLNSLRKIILYLSLLYSHNWRCAHEIFKVLSRTEEVIALMKTVISEDLMEHLLTVYTLAINHPAFSLDEKRSLHSIYDLFPKNEEGMHLSIVHGSHGNIDTDRNYPDGAEEREVFPYPYAVQQGQHINNVPYNDGPHHSDVNFGIPPGNHIGYAAIIPTWATAVPIPRKEFVNSQMRYASRSSSPGTSSIPSRPSSPNNRAIYERPVVPIQLMASPTNNLDPHRDAVMKDFINTNISLQNYSPYQVSQFSDAELLAMNVPEQMIQQLRISLNEPQTNGLSCETNSDLVHLQSSGPSSAPAILCTTALPFFNNDVLAPCVSLQEHFRALSVGSSSASTSTGSNSDAALSDSPPNTPLRSKERNVNNENSEEDKKCMPPPAPPNDNGNKPRLRASTTSSASRVKTTNEAIHRKRADSLNGCSEDNGTWTNVQSDSIFSTVPGSSLPYLPVGNQNSFLPRQFYPVQSHGEVYYHTGPFIPVPSPFNPVYTGGVVSCFNCGSNAHLGIECTEPTIEETTKPGQYKLDFTSNSTRDDSPTEN